MRLGGRKSDMFDLGDGKRTIAHYVLIYNQGNVNEKIGNVHS